MELFHIQFIGPLSLSAIRFLEAAGFWRIAATLNEMHNGINPFAIFGWAGDMYIEDAHQHLVEELGTLGVPSFTLEWIG